ncbi:hypothetical protein [Brevundimonas sp.]|uniref:hypothetical protein n=1 Tax=Brevundimonas sp. TaxID=1871086 RepID=UPI0025EB1DA4|nr:hypothetical protein [Brevundimonas sp.]
MRRRDFITVSLAKEEERPTPSTFDMTTIGLPVITDGRIRNYVFVRFRLHLATGHDPMTVRDKDPHLRDSIVRAAHRRPFTLPDDWTRLDGGPMAGWVMAAAATICGRGVVERVSILSQDPQRRTGVRPT